MTNLIQYYNFKVSTSSRSFEGEAALLILATSQLHRRNSIQEIANASPATSLAGQIALRAELLCYSTDWPASCVLDMSCEMYTDTCCVLGVSRGLYRVTRVF
jgi:hypothetical protein